MKVAILQFAPRLGEVAANIKHAEDVLATSNLNIQPSGDVRTEVLEKQQIDLLVLPELAFSGYNFPSLNAIQPYLEPTAAGPSARWAATAARQLDCLVAIGYPETTDKAEQIPSHVVSGEAVQDASLLDTTLLAKPQRQPCLHNFNSLVVVDPRGTVCAHYRKTHLYYTDSTWAEPSPTGWQVVNLPLASPAPPPPSSASLSTPSQSTMHGCCSTSITPSPSTTIATSTSTSSSSFASPQPTASTSTVLDDLHSIPATRTAFAICMDLNPQYFTAPWTLYEAATYAARHAVPLLLTSMAWLSDRAADGDATDPEMLTVAYWLERLTPLLARTDGAETLIVLANRTGMEPGALQAYELDPAVRKATTDAVARNKNHDEAECRQADDAQQPGGGPVAVNPLRKDNGQTPERSGVANLGSVGGEAERHKEDTTFHADSGVFMLKEARYAGSSTVMSLGNGRARVFGILGRREERVLIVDTEHEPVAVYRLRGPDDEDASDASATQCENSGAATDDSNNGAGSRDGAGG